MKERTEFMNSYVWNSRKCSVGQKLSGCFLWSPVLRLQACAARNSFCLFVLCKCWGSKLTSSCLQNNHFYLLSHIPRFLKFKWEYNSLAKKFFWLQHLHYLVLRLTIKLQDTGIDSDLVRQNLELRNGPLSYEQSWGDKKHLFTPDGTPTDLGKHSI